MPLPPELEAKKASEIDEAHKFSFDVAKFNSDIAEGDLLTMVIRGQIYLEHVLIQTLQEELRQPQEMDVRRLNFAAKLNLCIAMGLLPAHWRAAVLRINDMRNKMAHRLDHAFTNSDKVDLIRLFPDYAQQLCLEEGNLTLETAEQATWSRTIRVVPVMLDVSRQELKAQRIERRFAAIFAGIVLRETDPARKRDGKSAPEGA